MIDMFEISRVRTRESKSGMLFFATGLRLQAIGSKISQPSFYYGPIDGL